MQSTENHIHTLASVVVSDFVGTVCVGDIDLDRYYVRLIVGIQRLNVLIDNLRFVRR